MKSDILFSGKNKKNINLSSAEFVQGVVKVHVLYRIHAWSVSIVQLVH